MHRSTSDEDTISVVDIGLIAQVYANLFSNALKYTQEIVTITGEHKKYISYGREFIPDFFGPGRNGIKYFNGTKKAGFSNGHCLFSYTLHFITPQI
jgi:hypothetical protein